jgi:hypothetical protein
MTSNRNSLVHIGYHKTATNWFQRLYYPFVSNADYVDRKLTRAALLEDSALQFDRDKAWDRLEVSEQQRLILCEEELSGNIHNGGLFGCLSKDVAYRTKALLPDASIIIFIRNQVDMIASVYNQYLKEGGTHNPDRYFFHQKYLAQSGFSHRYAPLFLFDHFDYLPLVKLYQQVFGKEKVFVYLYEDFRQDLKSFMTLFEQTHHLEAEWLKVSTGSVNLSYKTGTIALAKILNRFSYRDVSDKRYWLDTSHFFKRGRRILNRVNHWPIMGKVPTPEELLGKSNIEFIQSRYAESNQTLQKELGLNVEKHNYPF